MEDHKRKKKRGRNKIFRSCFSLKSFDEKHYSYDKSDRWNPRNRRLRKPVLRTSNVIESDQNVGFVNSSVNVSDGSGDCYYKRCSHPRIISCLLKSVWFGSQMVKKIHHASSKFSISSDKITPFLSIKNIGNSTYDTENSSSRPRNSLSSYSQTTCTSSSSSSFSSSINSNSRSSDQNTSSLTDSVGFRHRISSNPQSHLDKNDPHRVVSLYSSNTFWKLDTHKIKSVTNNKNVRLCLFFLLSLVVLIVYGRIYSILFTSAWFYFLPCPRVKRDNSVQKATKLIETDSYQHKKRVIMAGLLDRARNPIR